MDHEHYNTSYTDPGSRGGLDAAVPCKPSADGSWTDTPEYGGDEKWDEPTH